MHVQIALTAVLIVPLLVTQTEPPWQAPSLAVTARKLDDLAANANLPLSAFTPKPRRPPNIDDAAWAELLREWEIITKPLRDFLYTVHTLSSFPVPHHVSLKVERATPQQDGSLVLTAGFDPARPTRRLLSSQEEEAIRAWERRRAALGQTLTDPSSASNKPSRQPDDELVAAIQEKERRRQELYGRVSVEVRVPSSLAGSLDYDRMLAAESVMLLVRPTDIALHPPDAEINSPPTVAIMFAELVEPDPAMKKAPRP